MSVLRDVATAQGESLLADWRIFFYTAIVVAVIVYGLILLPLVLWRRRGDAYPVQFRQNAPLEIAYTIVPLLIVAVLFVFTFVYERRVEAQSTHPFATVDVTAFRWSWRFVYPRERVTVAGTPQAPPEFALPLDRTTRIVLTTRDVNHAFWIPQFLFKRDAIAGFTNSFDLRATRPGTYRGLCAEFCGLDHAGMTFTVRVLPETQYRAWLASHRAS